MAFCDDDSWWTPGSLARASAVFDCSPRLGLVAAKVVVGDEDRIDPACIAMASGPLGTTPGVPGPEVLGFIACGAIVRREAFLESGGFHPRFGVGGEEELLALSLASRGWDLVYMEDVVAHHHPSPGRDPGRRTAIVTRNHLWTTWLRRPARQVAGVTARVAAKSIRDRAFRDGIARALAGLPWVLNERSPLPRRVEKMARLIESSGGSSRDGGAPKQR